MQDLRTSVLFCLAAMSSTWAHAQEFINGDLEGPAPTVLAQVAYSWLAVPDNDPVCLATNGSLGDTPDLTDINGPSVFTGIFGNPYSGATFMSGERADGTVDFQEGIMQQVMNFVPGNSYTIRLHQAVVKSYGCPDSSGSWVVYVDNTMAGITQPTTSTIPFDSAPFIWEERLIPFTATGTYHTIKFLPFDDDTNLDVLDPGGCLRMGIDLVSILQGNHATGLGEAERLVPGMVWPMPFTDHLMIRTGAEGTIASATVWTMTGAQVHAEPLSIIGEHARIDLAALPPGPYVLRVQLSDQERRQVIVKQ
jgi:hypothetical protein